MPVQCDCDELDLCMTTSRKIRFNKFVSRRRWKQITTTDYYPPTSLYSDQIWYAHLNIREKKTLSTATWYESMKFLCTYRDHWTWPCFLDGKLRVGRGHVAIQQFLTHKHLNLWHSLHLLCVQFFNHILGFDQPQTNRSDNFSRGCHPLFLLVFDPLHRGFEDEGLWRSTEVISAEKIQELISADMGQEFFTFTDLPVQRSLR